jgi:DNA-binding transcriptional LysR family regulator
MRLTHLGQAVAEYARAVVNDLTRLRDEADALAAGATGKVLVGSILAPVPNLLSAAIASVSATHPGITVAVLVDESDRLTDLLRDGQLDFVLGRSHGATAREVRFESLREVDLAIVAGPGHPLRAKRAVSADLLAAQRWILPPPKTGLRMTVEDAFRHAGVQPPTPMVETISNTLTVSLLQSTHAVSVMTASVAAVYGNRLIRQIDSPLQVRLGPYGVLTRQGRRPSPAAALLLDRLRRDAAGKDN